MNNLDITDPTFVEDIKASHPSVEKAAEWLRTLGFKVRVNPLVIRPDSSVRHKYSDGGDLHITIKTPFDERVEVKHRQIMFHSVKDFPYPTVMVDICYNFNKANPKPLVYIIFNKDLSSCYLIYIKQTQEYWIKTTKKDKHCGRVRDYYECPIENVLYRKIEI